MGPKKEKKEKKKKLPAVDSVKTTTELTFEQLEDYAWSLWQEIQKQRYERDWFQVEKEKIRSFLHIDKIKLLETYSAIRNKDREFCEILRRQEAELIEQKEEVKAVHMGQEFNITEGKVGQFQKLKITAEEKDQRLLQLKMDLQLLRNQMKLEKLSFKEDLKRETMAYNTEMREMLEDLEEKARCIERKFDTLLESDRLAMNADLTAKQNETEGRKNAQLSVQRQLLDNVRFDLTQYYNTVTVNNLTLVKSLKNELESINTAYGRARNLCRQAERRRRGMKGPLESARSEIAFLKSKLADVESVKTSIVENKTHLGNVMDQKETMSVEVEVLATRYHKLEQENKFLYDSLLKEALDLQHRESVRFIMLQEKMKMVTELLEANELKEKRILEACLKDTKEKSEARKKMEMLVLEKNHAIKELKQQLSSAIKAHNVLVKTLQIKMERYGMLDADLGFSTREFCKHV